ncbi:MAG: phosphoribosylaminoimidazole carboxylase synthetase [Herbinix sp.]|nr:phosphoribosylaminoimidazole carboxylase synthetase [Herbinix sp.]
MDKIKILVGNLECEESWADGTEVRIPMLDILGINNIIKAYDELFLFLGNKQDILILRNAPDPAYIDYIKALKITIPRIWIVKENDFAKSLGELILEDKELLDKLKAEVINNKKTDSEVELIPFGITCHEKKIADYIGVELSSSPTLSAKLNNKEIARNIIRQCGIALPTGHVCSNFNEFDLISKDYLNMYGAFIIKELYGSGGSSAYIIRTRRQRDNFAALYRKNMSENKRILIERYYKSVGSFNTQYYIINRKVIPYAFSRQILHNSKIMGSYFNNTQTLCDEIMREHFCLSYPAAKYIADQGYHGIVGFDSIIKDDKKIFPIVDINCRTNLSTIFYEILSKYFKTRYALFYCLELRNIKNLNIKELIDNYFPDKYDIERREGMIVLNFNSTQVNRSENILNYGRVFIGMFYNDETIINIMFQKLIQRITESKENNVRVIKENS